MKNDRVRIHHHLISNIYLIQPRNKNYVIYLFICYPSYIAGVFTNVITWFQLLPELPHVLSAPWGSADSFLSFPSLLSKLGNDKFSHCVLKAIKCYLVRCLAGWGKKCDLKTKAKIQEISPGYTIPVILWKSSSFLGHPWLVPTPHSCSWAGCAEPLALMTAVQKQK